MHIGNFPNLLGESPLHQNLTQVNHPQEAQSGLDRLEKLHDESFVPLREVDLIFAKEFGPLIHSSVGYSCMGNITGIKPRPADV
jgi:hypothetical protein